MDGDKESPRLNPIDKSRGYLGADNLVYGYREVSGQFVIAQKFIPHCPTPKRRRCANGSDMGLLFVLAKTLTAEVEVKTCQAELKKSPHRIIFCCFGEQDYEIYRNLLDLIR
jgi:hypothetical protein